MIDDLLKEFEIKYSLVDKIISFLNKRATRILRQRRDIFVDAIAELYSIKRACEVRGDNPRQVVSHLSKHLPQSLFLEDDLNYEHYPEMILALRRHYAGEFEPSKKLLIMALLARKFKEKFKTIRCKDNLSLFWFKTISELIHFLYDLKIEIKLSNIEEGHVKITINLPSFLYALILDGESISKEYLNKLLATTKHGMFLVNYEEKTEVYYPDNCEAKNIISELSRFTSVMPVAYSYDKSLIRNVARILEKHIISRKNITNWRLGSLAIDFFNMESRFRELLAASGYSIEISEPLINKPKVFLPVLLLVFSALHELESIIIESKPKTKATVGEEKDRVGIPPKQPTEPILSLQAPKTRLRIIGKSRLRDFKQYIGITLARYVTSAPIVIEDLYHTLALKEFLMEIDKQKELIKPTILIGNHKYIVHLCGRLRKENLFFCLVEAILEGEKSFGWSVASENVYMLSTPWNTTLLLVFSETRDKLKGVLSKIVSTYAQPLPEVFFEVVLRNCNLISVSENAHVVEILIALKNQLWICKNLAVIRNEFGDEAHIIRVSNERYMIDLHIKEQEHLEILRSEINFNSLWEFLIDFAERKISFTKYGFKLIAKEKFR